MNLKPAPATGSARLLPLALGLALSPHLRGWAPPSPRPVCSPRPTRTSSGVYWAKSVPDPREADGRLGPALPPRRRQEDGRRRPGRPSRPRPRPSTEPGTCACPSACRGPTPPLPDPGLSVPEQTTIFFEENRQVHVWRASCPSTDSEFWDPYHGRQHRQVGRRHPGHRQPQLQRRGLPRRPPSIPHSDKLKVVQQLRKIDGGKQLEVVTTVSTPTCSPSRGRPLRLRPPRRRDQDQAGSAASRLAATSRRSSGSRSRQSFRGTPGLQ